MSLDSFQLPEGWRHIKLGSIGKWGSGGTPDRRRSDFYGGSIPWIKIGDLNDGVVATTEETITEEGLAGSSAKLVDPGALLVAMYGASIGKLGITGIWSATNQAIAFCVPSPELATSEFLFQLLLYLRPILISEGKGGAQPNISQTVLKSLDIPLPPLDQQAGIVQTLESIAHRRKDVAQQLAAAVRRIEYFRQATLAAACSGRLTSDWRDQHPMHSAMARASRQDVSPLVETPDAWPWVQLQDVADVRGGIQKGAKLKPGEPTREVPYLRVANVQRGWLDLSEIKTIPAPESKIADLKLQPGDILFNEGGDRDKLGRGWVWEGQIPECIHQNHVFRARLRNKRMQPRFYSWFGNTIGARYFIDQGKQTVNLASLSMTKLKELPVPVPSPQEQSEIVRRVDELLQVADGLLARVEKAVRRIERSSQAVLAKAFRGELLPTGAGTFATPEEA